MNTEEYRRLIREHAESTGTDADHALREFIEVVGQMNAARRESERLHVHLLELGRQYAFYRNGEPYDPKKLLDEKELGRRYAQAKARLRSVNKTLSIRCNQANTLLGGGIHFVHGQPVDSDTPGPRTSRPRTSGDEIGELVILTDPDDGEPIILEILR